MLAPASDREPTQFDLCPADQWWQNASLRNIDFARNSVPTPQLSLHFAICVDSARESVGHVTVCRAFGLFD